MALGPPSRPADDFWPESYGREMPPPLDPRGEILSMSAISGRGRVRRAGRPDADAARRHEHLRRAYAVWLRLVSGHLPADSSWRGGPASEHWRQFRTGYLACLNGDGEDVALEDHAAWTERVMAMPAGRGLHISDTEEGPLPLLPGTMFITDAMALAPCFLEVENESPAFEVIEGGKPGTGADTDKDGA